MGEYRTQELIVAKERKKEREKETLAVVIQEWVSFLPVDILRLKREDDG